MAKKRASLGLQVQGQEDRALSLGRERENLQAVLDGLDRKSTRLNSSHTVIYTLSLHDALPIYGQKTGQPRVAGPRTGGSCVVPRPGTGKSSGRSRWPRSEEHTSELQSHRDLHSFPTRRSSDLWPKNGPASGCRSKDRRIVRCP